MAKMVISHTTWTTVDVPDDVATDAINRYSYDGSRTPVESLVDYVKRAQPGMRACEALLTYAVAPAPGTVTEEYAVVKVDGVDTV